MSDELEFTEHAIAVASRRAADALALSTAQERIRVLEEALKPFAEFDQMRAFEEDRHLTMADFRAAARALTTEPT